MAYGLYIYKDLSAGFRLEIHRKDWTGAATEIRAMGTTPLSLVGLDNRGSDVLTPIIKSTLNIDIKDLGEIDFQELFTSYATRYKVLVFRNGVQVWGGYLTPDSYSQDLEYRTSINLVARDNLGQLDQLDFDYFNEDGDGMVKVANLITKAQEKIEWVMAPIEWYAQQYVASDGTSVKDSYINARLFKTDGNEDAKTWWEVLETVLSSLGQQIRYVGNNKVYIINVADLYEVGNINGSTPFDYTIGSAANMEITPSWRQLTVKQDFGLIDNAIAYEQDEEYFEQIALEAGPYNRHIYRNNFFKYTTPAGTTAGELQITNPNSNIKSVLQYDGPLFYNNFQIINARQSGETFYNALLFDIFRSAGLMYFPLKVTAGSSFVFQFTAYDHVHRISFTDTSDGFGNKITAIPHEATTNILGDHHVYIRLSIQSVIGSNILYMNEDNWSANKNIIEFDLPLTDTEDSTSELTINILNVPQNGELRIVLYPPLVKCVNAGGEHIPSRDPAPDVYPFNSSPTVIIKDIDFHTLLYEDMSKAPGEMEIVGVANEDGNTKESVDITVGEVPSSSGDSLTYAGGLFDASIGRKALTGWHRRDNKGGVLHLSELVGRGFAHHFCAFRNVNDEKTGGKVLTGTVPFPETAFFSKHFTIDDEVYIVNAATMDMLAQTAEVELRQVLPYVHQSSIYEANEISGGGSSSIGGGSTKTISWGTPREAVRLYELPTVTAEDAKKSYLLLDKDGDDTAHKYPASELLKLTDWFFFDEQNQAVGTKYPLYSEKTLSQLGPAGSGGEGGGGGGTYYHDQLLNLDYPDQHPIAAIIGLQTALNSKANAADIPSWALKPSKPSYDFSELTDKPTTLAGYGITDAMTAEAIIDAMDQKLQNYYTFKSYTADGLFGETASPAVITGRAGTGRILFGYRDYGSGDYCPNIGFQQTHDPVNSPLITTTKLSLGLNRAGQLVCSGTLVVEGNIVVNGTITQLGG